MLIGNALTLCADKALYLGEIPATGWHRHAAPVLLLGLSGRFRLLLPKGREESCHSALIDAGVEHVFDPQGERVALMYLEPDAPSSACTASICPRCWGRVACRPWPAWTRAC